jgi:opacity protein-like surface antigen
MVTLTGFACFAGNVQAAGIYAGIDLVQLDSKLDFQTSLFPTEKYTTNHVRLKGGIEATNWLAVEAQLLNGADDNTVDILGDTYNYDTGMILGVFAKPHMTIGSFDMYGLVGYATADAEYDCVPSCPPKFKATLNGLAYGAGAQFLVNKNLKISLDYMVYHDGKENFRDGVFSAPIDVNTSGFGIGVNYTF